MDELFYLQDSRSYVGNDVLWWAKEGKGYTTDLSKAHVFTKEEALSQHNDRETDIPWPKSYIDQKTRPAVDMQYIRRDEALKGSGIVLRITKPRRPAPSGEGTEIAVDEGSTLISIPVREWTPITKKRLHELVEKAALKTITQEERRELRDLQSIRRENVPGRTYEDIMRTAELDRRIANLKKALEEYVNYISD